MRDTTKYQGIIPAFYACYDEEGNISTKGVEDLTHYLVKKGVKGVYVGGSSGECIYQSVEERKNCTRTCCESCRGKTYYYVLM
ncbi:MAG: dihydrodipicolinate synthase family protein [Blautia wexlerae]